MSHPSLFQTKAVPVTPSRRLNTLAARAQARGLHTALHRTMPADNRYSEQYRLRITVPHPGLHCLEIMATRSKTRFPLQPWHFYLTYAIKGETKATSYMRRWRANTVEYYLAQCTRSHVVALISRALAARAAT